MAYEEGHAFAQKEGLYFLETSAVSGHVVDDAFIVTTKLAQIRNQQTEAAWLGNSFCTTGGRGRLLCAIRPLKAL